jgi:CDP-glucose 4,6-dehydratase
MHLGKFGKKRQMNLFSNIYKDKKVLVTGHTGFKGTWLSFWLTKLGAQVIGISDKVITSPAHFELLKIDMQSFMIDIRNKEALNDKIQAINPDIVFHLAAQSLVRYSYLNPVETFQTNVMGTVNILEACRLQPSVKAIVVVTSDKCYENLESGRTYSETDPMGGYDPYSSSKGCAELVVSSYRNSFFNLDDFGYKHHVLVASARAGNVIGGGDWSTDRLIPDIIRAAVVKKEVIIRNPQAVRPWQHVLEPVYGYLLLGAKLLAGEKSFASAWNFGPRHNEVMNVNEVLNHARSLWNDVKYKIEKDEKMHEAQLLMLDCSKANDVLNWHPVWNTEQAIYHTINWYREYYLQNRISTKHDFDSYLKALS